MTKSKVLAVLLLSVASVTAAALFGGEPSLNPVTSGYINVGPMPKDFNFDFNEDVKTNLTVRVMENSSTIVSFHKDGRVTWDERITADAAGRAFVIAVSKYLAEYKCVPAKAKP